MTGAPSWHAAVRLARPAQWPILTCQFLLGVLLAAPAAGAGFGAWWTGLSWPTLAGGWLAWVVLLNGGTLAYNSAYDRDTGPVAYLPDPPLPPPWLAAAALAAMTGGALLGALLAGPLFGGVTAVCVILSVLYSHPAVRLKGRPGWDLVVNVIGYGAATTLAGLALGHRGAPGAAGWWLTAGFGLLFGSFYPLTQVYQAAADRARGDRTLTTALGTGPALGLALMLGSVAAMALLQGLRAGGRLAMWGYPAGALVLWCVHLAWWRWRAAVWDDRRHERGMYHALGLWALVDIALAVGWLGG